MYANKGLTFLQRCCSNSSISQFNKIIVKKEHLVFRCSSTSSGSGIFDQAESKTLFVNKKVRSGQPTYQTHPHLLKNNEVTVGITFDEYKDRRNTVMDLLCKAGGQHHVLVLSAMPKRYMIDKIPFLFRQDTDFLYCSGCLEPDCVLIVHTLPSTGASRAPHYKSIMFCPSISSSQVVWDGPRTAFNDASQVWGVDEGLPLSDITNYLTSLEKSLQSPTLWYHHKDAPPTDTKKSLLKWLSEGRGAGLESPKVSLHRARLVKSVAEKNLMRKACRISAEAITSTMLFSHSGVSEHELFAKVSYENQIRGASQLAYPPVIAGGNRANVIHYVNNDQIVGDNEMVLMDAGGEVHGYSGDVSRTWPVNGKFSPAQRDLYEAVLQVQKSVIETLHNSRPSLDHLYRVMCAEIANVLTTLGIVPPSYSKEQKLRAVVALCPHHVSHYLGMDVHDTPTVPRSEPVTPGSVITVEPGLYIPKGCQFVPPKFHGLGVRIEDDILITETGYENLSSSCPTHPDEIEKLMARGVE